MKLVKKTGVVSQRLSTLAAIGISFYYAPSIHASTLQFWSIPVAENIALIEKAKTALIEALKNPDSLNQNKLGGLATLLDTSAQDANAGKYTTDKVIQDADSSTVKFKQTYKGLPVIGMEAMVHFDSQGNVHDATERQITAELNTTAALKEKDVLELLSDRYRGQATFDGAPKLQLFKHLDGQVKLVYHVMTKTTARHHGQDIFVDAKTGALLVEADRNFDLNSHPELDTRQDFVGGGEVEIDTSVILLPHDPKRGHRRVYSANTLRSKPFNDEGGYPVLMDLGLYDLVLDDGNALEGVDRSALNAYRSTGKVYEYFNKRFGYKSFDNKDTRLVSVVHMGNQMNNAFWSSEMQIMSFGDGDGKRLLDLTYGLDVTAHEITHGVTGSTANLVYAAESGALNESYSDFFGRMVDYDESNWDIGASVMGPGSKRRAIRNMKNPTEFNQPDRMDSKLKIPTNQPCTYANDRCGVHGNSGIPNRAAYLIVQSIGKEKTEKIYFNVLTRRLTATSNFNDAKVETIKECGLQLGENSSECAAVKAAFDEVQM